MSGLGSYSYRKRGTTAVGELKKKSAEQLNEVYEGAETPCLRDLNGEYTATVLAGEIVPVLPTRVVAFANPPWDAWTKDFRVHSDKNVNVVNSFSMGVREVGRYIAESSRGSAIFDDGDCYVCDYDTVSNPAPVRGLRESIRRICNGLYLGRLYFTNGDYKRFLTYFALEKD